ncbi:galactose oxidase [Teratosphaeria nubilosa]|uniref:Galactose oxidase n=1 Tax=Teratosphaeria nubilosa TaxID=161662 RepID=A0A6G1LCH8_9PEZI|nr:galactose oxidase [Teratosphaeria nubilosa]
MPASQTPTVNTTANLSGLVCNVHRTTGKEPHPLVGATTTILGDKLYVFGGRRLSRTKPQLTSNLYELDLVRRHWTKLNPQGDVPAARYFHSVCALGDTKLVCYGGMSPAPLPGDAPPDAQPEIIVMSDIHIFDAPTNTWTKVATADSPQGRYAHCAAILPSAAVFASANAPTSALHHNPQGSNPNEGTLGVSIDGKGGAEMIVVGGQDSANHYIEQISVFNLRSLKWTGTTGMGRSCGAYRSVVTPLATLSASQIGAGPHARNDMDDDDDDEEEEEEEEDTDTIGSGAPMLIYSNYNFLDVKLELQVRLTDGTLTEKPMHTAVSPPGLRFPNGGVIDNHFVVSGTFLTSSKQEYALWALDLRTLSWSRIDAGGSIFSQGSWNRGVLWNRRNAFLILGNRKRSLVDDYNNRRINFSNMCVVELEAFGLYDNPRRAEPTSSFLSASAVAPLAQPDLTASGRQLSHAAEELGTLSLSVRELADMDFLAIDGTRIPVNSRLIVRRWGWHFTSLLKESMIAAAETDTVTLRMTGGGNPARNSAITITPSVTSGATTLTNNSQQANEVPDTRSAPPPARPRLFYLPHTAPTLQALLHYLYTSTLPSAPSQLATPQIFCSLLQLARPYKIDGLLEAVVERLHESLDGRNAAAIFNAAAMGAGGGEGVLFASEHRSDVRESTIPIRTASLGGLEAMNMNGARGGPSLRVDTDVANGRVTRNTIRPGTDDETDDEVPDSAVTEDNMSENEASLSARSFSGRADRDREVWNGAMSSVVGLQKRGLRGLMEGRRMRERGRSDGLEGQRVGLGIA